MIAPTHTSVPAPRSDLHSTSRRSATVPTLWILSILLVWSCLVPGAAQLCAQAVPIGGEFAVSQSTTQCLITPDVAVAPDGRFVVTWNNIQRDELFIRRYDADASPLAGAEMIVSGTDVDLPRIGMDAAGEFVISWDTTGPQGNESSVRRFDSAGTPLGSAFSPGAAGQNASLTTVAVADGGEFVVAWRETSGANSTVKARRVASDGSFLGSEFTVSPSGAGRLTLDAAIEPDGDHFMVAWEDGDPIADVVAKRFASDGTAVGGEFVVNAYTTSDQLDARIAMAASGEFVIAWEGDVPGDGDGAALAEFAADGTPVAETSLGDTVPWQGDPAVAISNDGKSVFAIWTDTNPDALIETTLSANANALLNLDLPDGVPAHSFASVDVDDRDRVVVTWMDDPDLNNCSTIAAQRFQLYRVIGPDPVDSRVHSLAVQAAWKHWVYFPSGPSVLHVTLDGLPASAPNDADLYVRFGDFASLTDFDCRPFSGGGIAETCRVETTGPPILIGINGYSAGQIPFTLTVTETPPEIFADGFESGDTSAWSGSVP